MGVEYSRQQKGQQPTGYIISLVARPPALSTGGTKETMLQPCPTPPHTASLWLPRCAARRFGPTWSRIKMMMQPCSLHLHLISLNAQVWTDMLAVGWGASSSPVPSATGQSLSPPHKRVVIAALPWGPMGASPDGAFRIGLHRVTSPPHLHTMSATRQQLC